KLAAIGATVIACASVAITPVTAAAPITDATVAMIQQWANAVAVHRAGLPDQAVATVCRMSYRDRVDLNAGIDLFFKACAGEVQTKKTGEIRSKEDLAAQAVIDAGHAAGHPLSATFLKRATILHTDAAIFRAVYPGRPDRTAPTPDSSGANGSSR